MFIKQNLLEASECSFSEAAFTGFFSFRINKNEVFQVYLTCLTFYKNRISGKTSSEYIFLHINHDKESNIYFMYLGGGIRVK